MERAFEEWPQHVDADVLLVALREASVTTARSPFPYETVGCDRDATG